MQEESDKPHVSNTCASCNGDPGGIVWEGLVLSGVLNAADIAQILAGAVNERGVRWLFHTGDLHGRKIGRHWVITASEFVRDWQALGRKTRAKAKTPSVRRKRVINVRAREVSARG